LQKSNFNVLEITQWITIQENVELVYTHEIYYYRNDIREEVQGDIQYYPLPLQSQLRRKRKKTTAALRAGNETDFASNS
jgi:hypothetical protein